MRMCVCKALDIVRHIAVSPAKDQDGRRPTAARGASGWRVGGLVGWISPIKRQKCGHAVLAPAAHTRPFAHDVPRFL